VICWDSDGVQTIFPRERLFSGFLTRKCLRATERSGEKLKARKYVEVPCLSGFHPLLTSKKDFREDNAK